jgi:hypothetical protein
MSDRAILLVVLLIGPATCYLIGAGVESGKMRAQRKLPADEYCLCTNVATVGALNGGIWTEADNFVGALLPKQEDQQ